MLSVHSHDNVHAVRVFVSYVIDVMIAILSLACLCSGEVLKIGKLMIESQDTNRTGQQLVVSTKNYQIWERN